MTKNSRLLDLLLLLAVLALASWSSQPTQPSQAPPAPPPPLIPLRTPVAATASPTTAVWLRRGLQMHLEIARPGSGLKGATLRVSLRNTTAHNAFIPGTFCQEGEQADWWSHAVRVRVNDGPKSWCLGPSYGLRELHEHATNPMTIQPGQVLYWEFHLDQLDPSSDGEGWEQASKASRLQVTCELPQSDSTVVSNRINLGAPLPL